MANEQMELDFDNKKGERKMAENNTQLASTGDFSTALSERLDSVSDALPEGFNKARFVQNAVALCNDNKGTLGKFGKEQIMAGLLKGAYLGLDFYSKECYLIPYGSQLNFQTDYKGQVKLAKKYSIRPVKDIFAKLIREGDDFQEVVMGGEQTITFKPKPLNDGKIIGAFAVCQFTDGGMMCETMTVNELEAVRAKSKNGRSGPWADFTGEMYKKTVIRRLCKHIELDFENAQQQEVFAHEMDIDADAKEILDVDIEENANTVEFDEVFP